jgi:hypothetical protein
MLRAAAATAIAGIAASSEASVAKQYPRGKPPLAFYALSQPGIVQILVKALPAIDRK